MEEILYYFFNVQIMKQTFPDLLMALGLTIAMAFLIVVSGISLGLILAVLRSFQVRVLNFFIVVFIDVFRAIPALVIMMLIYFALPSVGIIFSPFTSAVIALGLVLAAFSEEIFWSGITSVDVGQWQASRSTGLGFVATLRYVVMAQAIRMVIPPLTNRTIAITKNTALASAISVHELLNVASSAQSSYANPTPLTLAALLYLMMFFPFTRFSRWLERKHSKAAADG